MKKLHLMTQRDQPYGSVRRCCEICGEAQVGRPDSYWAHNAWTPDPELFNDDNPGYISCYSHDRQKEAVVLEAAGIPFQQLQLELK